jgi:hypothetical protein
VYRRFLGEATPNRKYGVFNSKMTNTEKEPDAAVRSRLRRLEKGGHCQPAQGRHHAYENEDVWMKKQQQSLANSQLWAGARRRDMAVLCSS